MREPERHQEQLAAFFQRTGGDYTRFNYLGEWHSHPSFDTLPSATDFQTMQSLVEDSTTGVNFLVLLVCRQSAKREIQVTAVAFRAATESLVVPVELESEPAGRFPILIEYFCKLLGR
jgi:hypothetical protein